MNDEESSQSAELNSDHRDIDPRHGAVESTPKIEPGVMRVAGGAERRQEH